MKTSEAIEILEALMAGINYPGDEAIDEALNHAIEHMKRFQWRPISEAPDGITVFVITEAGYMGLATKENGHWARHGITIRTSQSNNPTNFMPLPDAPEVDNDQP